MVNSSFLVKGIPTQNKVTENNFVGSYSSRYRKTDRLSILFTTIRFLSFLSLHSILCSMENGIRYDKELDKTFMGI